MSKKKLDNVYIGKVKGDLPDWSFLLFMIFLYHFLKEQIEK